tara:strand:+ start:871 stop:1458 length:588 start_codon:yes stop_codon:yes gene_type:complete
MKSLASILVLFVFLASFGCAKPEVEEDTSTLEDTQQTQSITWTECSGFVGDHPCDFTFLDQHGKDWSLYNHVGDVILLDFSTVWCGYCQISAQGVESIHDQYSPQGFQWVTLLVDDLNGNPADIDDVTEWSSAFGLDDAPVLVADRSIIDSTGVSGYPVTSWPTFVLIDRDMKIAWGLNGWSETLILDKIKEMLQ